VRHDRQPGQRDREAQLHPVPLIHGATHQRHSGRSSKPTLSGRLTSHAAIGRAWRPPLQGADRGVSGRRPRLTQRSLHPLDGWPSEEMSAEALPTWPLSVTMVEYSTITTRDLLGVGFRRYAGEQGVDAWMRAPGGGHRSARRRQVRSSIWCSAGSSSGQPSGIPVSTNPARSYDFRARTLSLRTIR
jgi:hypothetical protein